MTWTKENPTVEGLYWWRSHIAQRPIKLYVYEYQDESGLITALGKPKFLCGEWQGPIVPEEAT